MYYKELLKVRNTFLIFAGICVLIAVVSALIPKSGLDIPASVHPRIPASLFFGIGGFVSAIFATILGTSLSCENDGHLEVVWTLPTPRSGYATRVFAVDAGAIAAMFALAVLASVWVAYAHGFGRYLVFEHDSPAQLLRFLLYPLAWFSVVQALTASVRSKTGAYAGLAWPVAFILILLYEVHLPPIWHSVFTFLNFFNPMVYAANVSGANDSAGLLILNGAVAAEALAGLSVFAIALALVQWRRLQA